MKLLIVLLFVSVDVFAQTSYTLEQCVEIAQKNSPQTELLSLVREAESLQLQTLRRSQLPQASLGGQASWQSQVTSFNVPLPNISIPTVAKDQYKATLDLTQNLWDGGLTKGQKRLAVASALSESRTIENNIYQLKEQISNLYFGALLADKQTANTQILQQSLENQLKQQAANVQNGTAIKSNTMAIEARLIELKQQQREIRSRKLAALQGLSVLTGQTFTENTLLQEPNITLKKNAEIDRPELKFFEAQKDLAEANKALVKAKYAPKFGLFATGGYGRPALNFLNPDFSTYFIGGATLRLPLSQLYQKNNIADIKQLDINKAKIDKQKELFLQQTQLKLAQQQEDLAKIEDQIKEDHRLIEIRAYMAKTAENRLKNGIITTSDYLLDVDNELIAKQNLSLHQVQLMQLMNNIKITKGQ